MPDKQPKQNTFMLVFDILFIMVLCFATLLTAMLMRGKVIVGSGGSGGIEFYFDPKTFTAIIVFLAGYLAYIIRNSDKELRQIIKNMYDTDASPRRSE
jgi:hypothetical protein